MPHSIFERVTRWAMENDGHRLYEIFNQIEYHADRRYYEYHPTVGPHPDFRLRLRDWLNSATEEAAQKALFEFVPHVFFVGSSDFNTLYRSAFNGAITRWVIDLLNLSILDPGLDKKLAKAIEGTWFCPVTDSMQIAAFYHINNISGRNERPDWHSLGLFGDSKKIEEFMQSRRINRIVLLEDFVGSGSQMCRAVAFALSLKLKPPILLVPLIVCPAGFRTGQQIARKHAQVTFEPVLALDAECSIQEIPIPGEESLFPRIRDLARRLYGKVTDGLQPDPHQKPYGPFGFAGTGALTVMYSNCPDNTLPLIHNKSHTWSPLFPRSTRI